MKKTNKIIKEELLNEILNSNMPLKQKLKVMKLLDRAFRKYLGIIYLSDQEIENNSILQRSM